MKQKITLSILTIVLLLTAKSNAQVLIADTLFGNGSLNSVLISQETNNYHVTKVLRTNDDKILVCGWNYDITFNSLYNDMVCFTPCGDVDSSFGINGLVHHTFDQRNQGWDYALQPDGKILCTGLQADGNAGSQQFGFCARYNSNGTPDSTFGTNGTNKVIGLPEFRNLFLMPNGKIICNSGGFAMRFKTNGMVDSSFATNGVLSLPVPAGINFYYPGTSVLRTDGKIITANPAYDGNDVYSLVQAYDTLGHIDSTFGTNGVFIDYSNPCSYNYGNLTLLQNTNKVLVAYTKSTGDLVRVFRITTSGAIDTTFGTNGFLDLINCYLTKLLPLNNDKFIVEHGNQDFHEYDSNGMPDPGFNLAGMSNSFGNYGEIGASVTTSNGEVTFGGWDFGKSFVVSRFITAPYVPTLSQTGNTLHPNVPNVSCTYQWFNNGTAINGATDSSFNVTAAGIYSVEVTNIWGCANSAEINATFDGINEVENNSVTVYPNPTSNSVTVQFSKSVAQTTVSLFDVLGKKVFEKQYNNLSSAKIDISSLTDGIYSVNILNEDGSNQNFKIVKIK